MKNEVNTLLREHIFYKKLKLINNINIMPKYYGLYEDDNNYYLVIQLLGLSLEKINKKINKKFDIYSIKNIAIKLITCIKHIHNSGILHRDIKPDNILLSNDYKNIYLIDYGLSKFYIKKGKHIIEQDGINPSGTLRYMSKYVNNLKECSRRDDLISTGYTLIYLLKGRLPWQGLKIKEGGKKYEYIGKIKNNITLEELCSDLPICVYNYMEYCYKLKFADDPDYNYLGKLFI